MLFLSISEKVKKIDPHVFIIFVSNYPEYMQDSFRIHPFYYLIKPLKYYLSILPLAFFPCYG